MTSVLSLDDEARALARPTFQRQWKKRQAHLAEPLPPTTLPLQPIARLSSKTEENQDNEKTQVEQVEAWCKVYSLQTLPAFIMVGQPAYDQPEPWEGYQLVWGQVSRGEIAGVAAQALDRFTRDVGEADRFFKHCLTAQPQVRRMVIAGQLYDLKDPNHYKSLIDQASAGQAESAHKRQRSLNKGTQKAKSGSAAQGGFRPFGYQPGGLELDKAEAKEVRNMVRAFLGGKALLAISEDLNARGVKTSQGGTWNHNTVKQVLTSWRIAGWRSHYDAPVQKAAWPAIVTRAQVEAVRAIIETRQRPKGRPKQLLTGLLFCSHCGAQHHGCPQHRQKDGVKFTVPAYQAKLTRTGRGGHNTVKADEVEAEVAARVFFRLSNGGWRKLAQEDNSEKLTDLKAQLACLEAAAESADNQLALGTMTEARFEKAMKVNQKAQEDLRHQVALLAIPAVPANELQHLEARWGKLTQQEQRQGLEAVLTRIDLDPGKQGQPFDPSRVHIRWK